MLPGDARRRVGTPRECLPWGWTLDLLEERLHFTVNEQCPVNSSRLTHGDVCCGWWFQGKVMSRLESCCIETSRWKDCDQRKWKQTISIGQTACCVPAMMGEMNSVRPRVWVLSDSWVVPWLCSGRRQWKACLWRDAHMGHSPAEICGLH